MIPKRIHFVWLGSKLPDLYAALVRRCSELHPGWQVKVWNSRQVAALIRRMGTKLERRFLQRGLTLSTRSDLARYHILAQEGGIYLDTDFLVLRSMEPLLQHSFFGVYQQPGLVCSGVFGTEPKYPVFKCVFQHLRRADYRLSPERLAGPWMFSPLCQEAAARDFKATLLPPLSFLPVHFDEKHTVSAWLNRDLRQSYAIHLWAHSWGPNGGDGDSILLGRIGAVLLNNTSSTPAKGK